jgi:hypothetical protein
MSNFWITGDSVPVGSSDCTPETRSRMSWTACSTGTPSSNSTTIWLTPSKFVERSVLMPLSVLIASSIGSATFVSIVSGSPPG